MKSTLLIVFLRALSLLPLGMVRIIGRLFGQLNWILGSRMLATSNINLGLCFPEMEANSRKLLAKNSILNTFQTIAEGGPAWFWTREKVLAHILEVEGLDLLKAAKATGNGVVVLAPHLGNWEIFGYYLNNCGCGPSSQLYQAPRDARLDKIIFSARSRSGARMVATDNRGVANLLKALKNGEVVGILPDQVPNESGGEFAPFFGQQALTMTLVTRLIEKTGAAAVLGYAKRIKYENKSGWKIVFREPDKQIYAEHILNSLTALNQSIASAVAECPEQYQWEYKRFRRVPEGKQRPY